MQVTALSRVSSGLGEWMLLESKYGKFCPLFAQGAKCVPILLALIAHHGSLRVWPLIYFQNKTGCYKCSFPWRSGESRTITWLFKCFGSSWVHLAMTVLQIQRNFCGRESMLFCWIPQFSIWTWNLFAVLQGCFVAFSFQWCKSCLLLSSP